MRLGVTSHILAQDKREMMNMSTVIEMEGRCPAIMIIAWTHSIRGRIQGNYVRSQSDLACRKLAYWVTYCVL